MHPFAPPSIQTHLHEGNNLSQQVLFPVPQTPNCGSLPTLPYPFFQQQVPCQAHGPTVRASFPFDDSSGRLNFNGNAAALFNGQPVAVLIIPNQTLTSNVHLNLNRNQLPLSEQFCSWPSASNQLAFSYQPGHCFQNTPRSSCPLTGLQNYNDHSISLSTRGQLFPQPLSNANQVPQGNIFSETQTGTIYQAQNQIMDMPDPQNCRKPNGNLITGNFTSSNVQESAWTPPSGGQVQPAYCTSHTTASAQVLFITAQNHFMQSKESQSCGNTHGYSRTGNMPNLGTQCIIQNPSVAVPDNLGPRCITSAPVINQHVQGPMFPAYSQILGVGNSLVQCGLQNTNGALHNIGQSAVHVTSASGQHVQGNTCFVKSLAACQAQDASVPHAPQGIQDSNIVAPNVSQNAVQIGLFANQHVQAACQTHDARGPHAPCGIQYSNFVAPNVSQIAIQTGLFANQHVQVLGGGNSLVQCHLQNTNTALHNMGQSAVHVTSVTEQHVQGNMCLVKSQAACQGQDASGPHAPGGNQYSNIIAPNVSQNVMQIGLLANQHVQAACQAQDARGPHAPYSIQYSNVVAPNASQIAIQRGLFANQHVQAACQAQDASGPHAAWGTQYSNMAAPNVSQNAMQIGLFADQQVQAACQAQDARGPHAPCSFQYSNVVAPNVGQIAMQSGLFANQHMQAMGSEVSHPQSSIQIPNTVAPPYLGQRTARAATVTGQHLCGMMTPVWFQGDAMTKNMPQNSQDFTKGEGRFAGYHKGFAPCNTAQNVKRGLRHGWNGQRNFIDGISNVSIMSRKCIPKRKRIFVNYTDDEIKKWREDRKKNFPTQANIIKKLMAKDEDGRSVDAKMRRQQLKEILAKQAELGVEVAEIPRYYLSDSDGKPGDDSQRPRHRWQGFHSKFGKRGRNYRMDFQHIKGQNMRKPTLLERLLRSEIRRDKSHLLQVFRFMVLNSFFTDWPGRPLKFPLLSVKDGAGSVTVVGECDETEALSGCAGKDYQDEIWRGGCGQENYLKPTEQMGYGDNQTDIFKIDSEKSEEEEGEIID